MQINKHHIATFLLLGFLFPQVAGSMHYTFVAHAPTGKKSAGYAKPDTGVQYHSCIYHLSGFSSLLPGEYKEETSAVPEFQVTHNYFSLAHYVLQPNYNFQLRGPPF